MPQTSPQSILLLLDIKMPRVDGIEVLRQLKSDPQTASIPVIMLTTTDDPREVQRCYELGCSVYITKPVDYQAFVEAINRLGLFLQVVRIPDFGPARTLRVESHMAARVRHGSCSSRMIRASPGSSSFSSSAQATPWSRRQTRRSVSNESPPEGSS